MKTRTCLYCFAATTPTYEMVYTAKFNHATKQPVECVAFRLCDKHVGQFARLSSEDVLSGWTHTFDRIRAEHLGGNIDVRTVTESVVLKRIK